jgi:hypothetical protein
LDVFSALHLLGLTLLGGEGSLPDFVYSSKGDGSACGSRHAHHVQPIEVCSRFHLFWLGQLIIGLTTS